VARHLARSLITAALAAAAAAVLAGACNPSLYDDYTLGASGSSPGTGGTTGVASCGGFYSDDTTCQSCFADSYCCTQASSCNDTCKDYIACSNQCSEGDTACQASCDGRYDFEPDTIAGLLDCLATECPQCTGLRNERGGTIGTPQGSSGAGGALGQRCQADNACIDAACKDCDEGGSGSCETDTSVSKANCGGCGRNCMTTACDRGQCLSTSVASGVHVSTRLVSGGGFLYWITTPEQLEGLADDTLYRVDVANSGSPEQAYVPPSGLKVFDLAADAKGFYLVTSQGVKMREHASVQQPAALAIEQNVPLGEPTAPDISRISVNESTVFFTTPLPEGGGTQVWSVPKAGGTAQSLTTFSTTLISMLVADASGVFVGSNESGNQDTGISYVPSGGGKSQVYGNAADEFAVSGDDLIIVDKSDFDDKLVALAKDGGATSELLSDTFVPLRALAADAGGLYYLSVDLTGGGTSLMRLRRESGASSVGTPTKLLDNVPEATLGLPLALDANWIYGASSGGTSIFRVPK
jgi:hypothetical protein